jgi:stringent starvation protein B
MAKQMTSNRPYLLRALYQWIIDNGMTPHVLVDAGDSEALVPAEHVKDGKIVLNISPQAVPDLVIGDDAMTFRARFSGRSIAVRIPLRALLAIYARENGKGMAFPPESPDTGSPAPEGGDRRPVLKVVK